MKKFRFKKVGIAALCACAALTPCLTACGNTDNEVPDDPGVYGGVTDTTIYVGNTAGTTGELAKIGGPFNYGIKAAFWEYNQGGGFSGTYNGKAVTGLNVALKTYDDGGVATSSVTYMNRLIEEDEVFAIVGNFGSYAVQANLDIIKEAGVPMVYAAAGNESMANAHATGTDRYIFPVQPISSTEGAFLIRRAFAPAEKGGLAGTKVGVISNNNEVSVALLNKIRSEANSLTEAQKNNISYQNVSDTETGYGTAATALKNAGCDVVIIALATDYIKTVSALMDAGFNSDNVKLLTTFNNASSDLFDVKESIMGTEISHFDSKYTSIINAVHAHGWIDVTSLTNKYTKEGSLWTAWKNASPGSYDAGVPGFCEEFWDVAEVLHGYGEANDGALPTGFNTLSITYNAYALAGYIAGDLFCQGLDMLGDKALTRSNYVDAMESQVIDLALADTISYQNGQRLGVEKFTLNKLYAPTNPYYPTGSAIIHTLSSLDEIKG